MKTTMQSRLFSRFDPANKENALFSEHLQKALGLSEKQLDVCVENLAAYRLARLESELSRLFDSIEQETGLPQTEVEEVLVVLRFFLNRMLREEYRGDTPAQWAEDLVALQQIEGTNRELFVNVVNRIRNNVLPAVESEVRRRAYGEGILPGLKTCGTTVEIRGVQRHPYEWGKPVEKYVPEMIDIIGVVSVRIGLDSGTHRSCYFQMSEADLADLTSQLNAAEKDLTALNKFISKRKELGGQ